MFAIKLRPFLRVYDKIVTRNVRSRRLDVPGPNPGLNQRLKAFQEENLKLEDDDAEEFIEESESDFHNVNKSYKEHLNETVTEKIKLRHNIVKEKYFKENMPNLLTWSEKEQIRLLASTQPDEWTPEKIAESFPVTPAIVKKLLKYPWKPATEERIARHDASAMRNWRDLKEGSLNIPDNLKEHFLKFSNRVIPPLNKKSIKVDITQEKNIGEFESIVKRCAAKENLENNNDPENVTTEENDSMQNKFHTQKVDLKRVTLDELTSRIKTRLEMGNTVNMPDKIMLDTVSSTIPADNNAIHNKGLEIFHEKSNENKLSEYKKLENDIKVMDYPERIRIPKKAYKKGATYKVNDCYYDHDGKFLYRVLGMS